MSKVIKALVINGRYKDETVRVTNVSVDDMGRKNAACFLANGQRANIPVTDLSIIEEKPEPEIDRGPSRSMPFVSGSSSSRTLTHTKNMSKPRVEKKVPTTLNRTHMAICETCGIEYNMEERKGRPGKITVCENCTLEAGTKN